MVFKQKTCNNEKDAAKAPNQNENAPNQNELDKSFPKSAWNNQAEIGEENQKWPNNKDRQLPTNANYSKPSSYPAAQKPGDDDEDDDVEEGDDDVDEEVEEEGSKRDYATANASNKKDYQLTSEKSNQQRFETREQVFSPTNQKCCDAAGHNHHQNTANDAYQNTQRSKENSIKKPLVSQPKKK